MAGQLAQRWRDGLPTYIPTCLPLPTCMPPAQVHGHWTAWAAGHASTPTYLPTCTHACLLLRCIATGKLGLLARTNATPGASIPTCTYAYVHVHLTCACTCIHVHVHANATPGASRPRIDTHMHPYLHNVYEQASCTFIHTHIHIHTICSGASKPFSRVHTHIHIHTNCSGASKPFSRVHTHIHIHTNCSGASKPFSRVHTHIYTYIPLAQARASLFRPPPVAL